MKLNELKIALVRQILHSEDADELRAVENTLAGVSHYALTHEQEQSLDASLARYMRGEARTFTPEQVRTRARKAARA